MRTLFSAHCCHLHKVATLVGCATTLAGINPCLSFPSPLQAPRLSNSKKAAGAWSSITTIKGMSSSTDAESTPSIMDFEKLTLGGDYAGLMAKFSPANGALVPVPEYLIPESMLEWGQEPSSLEVLVSEEWGSNAEKVLGRQILTILPEVGCGIDNLETTKTMESFDQDSAKSLQLSVSTKVVDALVKSSPQQQTQRLETIFSMPNQHRIRLTLDLQIDKDQEYQIKSPMIIYLERQTNVVSSQGTRADGGGLDARTVSTLMGDFLKKSYTFADKKSALEGSTWKSISTASTLIKTIHLPGNISISTGNGTADTSWLLEVSHFAASDEGLKGSRRTVERHYDGLESEVKYREETGEFVQ